MGHQIFEGGLGNNQKKIEQGQSAKKNIRAKVKEIRTQLWINYYK